MAVEVLERDGVDFRVETGTGHVSEVKHDEGKRNAGVTIVAEGLQYPLRAWVDTHGPVWPQAQAAREQGLRVAYRIEIRRARGVAASQPWDSLAPKDKLRDLVALDRITGTATPAASTPAQASPPPAPRPGSENPAAARSAPAAAGSAADRDPMIVALRHLQEAAHTGARPDELKVLRQMVEDLGAGQGLTVERVRQMIDRALAAPQARPAVDTGGFGDPNADPDGPLEPAPAAQPAAPAAMTEEAKAQLRGLLIVLRDAIRAGETEDAIADKRMAAINAGATIEQLRWASGLTPNAGQPGDPASEALAAAKDPDRLDGRAPAPHNGPPASPPPAPSPVSGLGNRATPAVSDPPPYVRSHEHGPLAGQLNLSSYEVQGVIELVQLAQKITVRRLRAQAQDGAAMRAPTRPEVLELARALLLAADRVQVAVRGGRVDRMAGLHSRARWAVREAVDLYPWPADGTDDEKAAWTRTVEALAADNIRLALELLT